MIKVLVLISGGALGTVVRYFLSEWIQRISSHPYPWGILSVNILGSLLIGFCASLFSFLPINPHIRLFLFTGFFGGFTTFSTFTLDTLTLMRTGEYKLVLFNVLASNILGLLAVFIGYIAGKHLTEFLK